jgi:hypothetical protein
MSERARRRPPRRCAQQPGDQPATPYLAAPATADIIIGANRPSSIVAPNLRTTIPLNENGDVDQQPQRRLGPIVLIGAARSHSSLESAAASRARVRGVQLR